MRVAVTGATGFVGQRTVEALRQSGHQVIALVRQPSSKLSGEVGEGLLQRVCGDLSTVSDWEPLLEGAEAVIHAAARVHQMKDQSADPLQAFRRANTAPTLALARGAQQAGVSRFIFLSSIKVNGESTSSTAFTVRSPAQPQDPYGQSKWEAEQGLAELAVGAGTGNDASERTTFVSVRSPMVYGPGGKGNVQRLLGLIRRGIPVPFGSIHNHRTMMAVDNLADLLVYLCEHGSAPAATVLAGDAESPSTAELYRALATAQGRSARILPCPVALLGLAGKVTGRSADIARLTESLQVQTGSTDPNFQWQPPLTFQQGISRISG
ncbi:NAD-dependent epimerase/dehydratase family protein [Psychromicrobium xiongbiense]|uniref:NAD-dependent epimerase/dehydratase family protein n=1 Tax=Psychromicrobium xiongbiense TaxID=3051184 RepID=UPI0025551609|nr:NAD-dependent epimerase/dehydratase family protein [Psychromicrobium sp. YIM S02556]